MMPRLAGRRESSVRLIYGAAEPRYASPLTGGHGLSLRGAQSLRRPPPAQVSKTLLQRASPVQFALIQLFRA